MIKNVSDFSQCSWVSLVLNHLPSLIGFCDCLLYQNYMYVTFNKSQLHCVQVWYMLWPFFLSVCCIIELCETTEYITEPFSLSSSRIIVVLSHSTFIRIPLGVQYRWNVKNIQFLIICKCRHVVTVELQWNANRKSCMACQSPPLLIILVALKSFHLLRLQ